MRLADFIEANIEPILVEWEGRIDAEDHRDGDFGDEPRAIAMSYRGGGDLRDGPRD